MSPLVSKISKTFRWLRWSTICAILFYMFFIGLILHSTTYKLQHTLKSGVGSDAGGGGGGDSSTASQADMLLNKAHKALRKQQTQDYPHKYPVEAESEENLQQQQKEQKKLAKEVLLRNRQTVGIVKKVAVSASVEQSSAANGNNVLNTPPEVLLATTFQQQNALRRSRSDEEREKRIGSEKSVTLPGVSTIVTKAAVADGISKRRGGKSSEPETVILAASSVNEKQILEKAFKR